MVNVVPDSVSHVETRGYWIDDATGSVSSGWFMLGGDGWKVIRRRVRGRNRWHFADVSSGRFVADSSAVPGFCRFGVAS